MYARFAAAIDRYAPDMALCEFYYAFADHNEPSTQHLQRAYYTKAQLAQEIYPTMLYHAPYYSFGINPCCWSKVFKKELLEQCLYPVTPKVKIGEDAAFTYPCLLATESLAYVDGCLYHYRNNAQSMTNVYDPKMPDYALIPYQILKSVFEESPYKEILMPQLAYYLLFSLNGVVRNEASPWNDKPTVDSKAVLKRFCGDAAVKAALLSVRTSSLPLHTRVVKLCLEHGKVQLLNLYARLLRYKL